MLVLLTRIDTGPSCVTGANVEYHVWIERVGPGAAIVSTFAASSRRSFIADGTEDGNVLLRVAEEDIVVVAEPMIDPHLKAIRVIG
jgi:hypothetical protein